MNLFQHISLQLGSEGILSIFLDLVVEEKKQIKGKCLLVKDLPERIPPQTIPPQKNKSCICCIPEKMLPKNPKQFFLCKNITVG